MNNKSFEIGETIWVNNPTSGKEIPYCHMAIIVSKASVRPSFHPEVKVEVKWPNTKINEWVPLWRCEKMIKQKRQAVINSLQKEVNESWELGGNDDPCNKMYVTKSGKHIKNSFHPKRLISVGDKKNDNTYLGATFPKSLKVGSKITGKVVEGVSMLIFIPINFFALIITIAFFFDI